LSAGFVVLSGGFVVLPECFSVLSGGFAELSKHFSVLENVVAVWARCVAELEKGISALERTNDRQQEGDAIKSKKPAVAHFNPVKTKKSLLLFLTSIGNTEKLELHFFLCYYYKHKVF
jgi:hypothetical protein